MTGSPVPSRRTFLPALLGLALACLPALARAAAPPAPPLYAGFGEADITPKVGGKKPVYLAGFGRDRKATGVHDPLRARAVVLRHGRQKLAIVSVDLVGFFLANVERVRARLPHFAYVLVTSTHNHEGPDTLGLWGPNFLTRGVDPDYLPLVEKQIVKAVRAAERGLQPATARIGTVRAPELLRDARLPIVKHDELVVLAFRNARGKHTGIVVQWNCHPETLGSRNTRLSSDFVGPAVKHLRDKFRCPVVYLSGTVGGMMTSLGVPIKSKDGKLLADGTFEKTQRYGTLLGRAAERALGKSKPLSLTPLAIRKRTLYLPLANKFYLFARQSGVLEREAFVWKGNPDRAERAKAVRPGRTYCIRTELGYLRLGQLDVAVIPGEIYPELVLGGVPDPAEKGADFPDAPIEPALYKQMRGPHRMIVGLGNDEIGYIIPKRQWDEKPPYCYGLKKRPYGEINSLGPDTVPLLCKAFADLVKGKK
jgi:hypothetical protein